MIFSIYVPNKSRIIWGNFKIMASRSFQQALLAGLLLTGSMLYAASDWEKAADLRKQDEIDKAEKLLRRYASPAGFEQLKSAEKIDFLRGLLELAHVRALQDEVAESLALLNWAEGREDPYQRSLACVKYAEILLDLGEFERAQGYLKNADEAIGKRAEEQKKTGAAIGQAGVTADTGAAWRELRDDSDALKAEIEAEAMKKKFGATYGSYVKLRRLQRIARRARTPRYRLEALKVADEIIETDPASQFAAAAGYLKGEILASRLKEDTPKKEIREVREYLERFIRQQPEGLYRGEALMLLGKISLEVEWDAKEAEKNYTQALAWFRKAREKRDAVSLYAAVNDDLKKQAAPTQKPASLNQWKLIVYHDEDPLKLYNTASSPAWYVDNKEKDILLWLGFLALSAGDADSAKKYWEQTRFLDSTVGSENSQYPSMMMRLMSACRFKMFILSSEELAPVKDRNMRLRLNYASMYYMMEYFPEADKMFSDIFNSTNDLTVKALCALCRGGIADAVPGNKKIAMQYFDWILKTEKLKGTLNHGSAIYQYANTLMGLPDGHVKALPMYREYLKKYQKNNRWDYYRDAGYKEIFCLILQKKFTEAKNRFAIFQKERDDSFVKALKYKFKVITEKGCYP